MSRFRTRPSDAGTSLAELMVSIVVFGIIAMTVTITVTMTLRTFRATTDRVSNLGGAQVSLDAMSKMIQTAAQPPAIVGGTPTSAIIKATGTDFKFYGYDNPSAPPAEIEFAVVNGNLLETVTPSTNSGPHACSPPYSYGTGSTRTIATGINAVGNVFSYYSQPTAANITGVALPFVGSPPALSTADLANVELVGINLSVGKSTNPSVTPTNASITVSLPNHLVATASLPGSAC